MEKQLLHIEIENSKHQKQIIVLCNQLSRPANYGMLVRICEAMGVKKLIFGSTEYTELTSKMKRASRSAENNFEVRFVENLLPEIKELKKSGFGIYGLEQTSKSHSINNLRYFNDKIVLICGNENVGISQEIIASCDTCVHLDLYGKNSSINVAMATSIALWQIIHS